jgi:hypothetical protein
MNFRQEPKKKKEKKKSTGGGEEWHHGDWRIQGGNSLAFHVD